MDDKELFKSMLNSICIIEEPVKTQNDAGEFLTGWQVKFADVPCRVQKKTARDNFSRLSGGQGATGLGEFIRGDYTIYCEVANVILNSDRVNFNGRIFEIIEASNDSSFNQYQLECKVIES